MIRKHLNYNRPLQGPAPRASSELETEGHILLRGVLDPAETRNLRDEILQVFETTPADVRNPDVDDSIRSQFRYEMFNRSPLAQTMLAHPKLLETVEPLLGDDCHVIANTAWRNMQDPAHAPDGQQWHVDGGPYIARPAGQPWPQYMAYPIFVITAQVYLESVELEDGPTAVLPASHRSGCLPPHEDMWDPDLKYKGRKGVVHTAQPGDVTFFVSDTWHRRLPPKANGKGRFFLQIVYGRREIAQRILPTERMSPASSASRARAFTDRERQLIGQHGMGFYDM